VLLRFFVESVLLLELVEDWVEDALPEALEGCVLEDWLADAPWLAFDVEPTSVDAWLAEVELFVVLLPLPIFTPGLTLALALRSVLLTPTFAFTSTFGFTLIARWLVSDGVVLEGVELAEPEIPAVPLETPATVVVLVLGAT